MLRTAFSVWIALGLASTVQAAGDPVAGQEKSAPCQACHGPDGNSVSPEWPSLAGMYESYIIKQLRDFQSGARVNETMSPMAMGLAEQDMADIAAYFSRQAPTPAEPTADATALSVGERLYLGGNKSNGVAACAGCHGPTAAGNGPAKFPALVAQEQGYIANQLRAFRGAQRANDPNRMMRDIAIRLTDGDIDAIAAYLATTKPAAKAK